MAMANCAQCSKLFNRTRGRICPACIEEEEQEFERVREYLRESEVRFVVQLSEETGVARAKILRWVEEGKLEVELDPSEQDLQGCKRCGHSTDRGDLCERCRKELASQIAQQRASMQTPQDGAAGAGAPASREAREGMRSGPR